TSSDIRGRAFSAILILHPFIASSPVRQNEPTHRAFEADDTSDLVSARKPRCERDARWDRARCREGPRTEWAPHNRTVYFAFSPACSAFVGGGRHAIVFELGRPTSRPATRRVPGIPVPSSYASPLPTTPGAKIVQATVRRHTRGTAHNSDSGKGARI